MHRIRRRVIVLVACSWLPLAPALAKGTVEATIEGDPLIRLLPAEGIPAIDEPTMVPAADSRLRDSDPVIGVALDGEARAYPTWVLDGHEIVNDSLGKRPIAATW